MRVRIPSDQRWLLAIMIKPIYFSVEETDNTIRVFNDSSNWDFDCTKVRRSVKPPAHNLHSNILIDNKEFLEEIKDREDIGILRQSYSHLMSFKNRTYYIYNPFMEYKTNRANYMIKLDRRLYNIKQANYKKAIEKAYADQSTMLHEPIKQNYSASKRVSNKINTVLNNCWVMTNGGSPPDKVRHYLLTMWKDILINLPEKAEYDYEDYSNKREIFWQHFPESWRTIWKDTNEGNLR